MGKKRKIKNFFPTVWFKEKYKEQKRRGKLDGKTDQHSTFAFQLKS